jgi:hypothetical protein
MTEPTMATRGSAAKERARTVEEQMTDEERFSLIISVIGATRLTARDRRPAAARPLRRPGRPVAHHPGQPQIAVGKAADNLVLTAEAVLTERLFGS